MWEPGTGFGIDEDARRLLRAGLIHAAPVAIGPAGEPLLAEMDRVAAALAEENKGRAPGEIAGSAYLPGIVEAVKGTGPQSHFELRQRRRQTVVGQAVADGGIDGTQAAQRFPQRARREPPAVAGPRRRSAG